MISVHQTSISRRHRALSAASVLAFLLTLAGHSGADEGTTAAPPPRATPSPTPSTTQQTAWRSRFDAARTDLVEGHYRRAEVLFHDLALEAPSPAERALAIEMTKLAAEYAERGEAGRSAGAPPLGTSLRGDIRGRDELTLLYASAFLYGAGGGTWFLLETQPTSGLTATLPFALITATPVTTIAIVDHFSKLPRGVPHAISAGLYVGLAESVALVGLEHARSDRIVAIQPNADLRWSSATTAGVLWAGASGGALLGGALGLSLPTTPGRVSWTASSALWSEALLGLTTAALIPESNAYRAERAFGVAALSAPAGLLGGALLAGTVSPTVARVRIIDLIGIVGGLSTGGLYLAIGGGARSDHRASPAVAEGLFALGATAGLATGFLLTSHMPKDEIEVPKPNTSPFQTVLENMEPAITPTADFKGVSVGVNGYLF